MDIERFKQANELYKRITEISNDIDDIKAYFGWDSELQDFTHQRTGGICFACSEQDNVFSLGGSVRAIPNEIFHKALNLIIDELEEKKINLLVEFLNL